MSNVKSNETDQLVSRRLRDLRQERGMTQTQLAVGLDITFQQVQKYERGTNRISAGMLGQISKILDVRIGYFFDEPVDAGQDAPAPVGPSPRTMMHAYVRVKSPEHRTALLALAQGLAG